jgi:hypothetical protein
MRVHTALPAIPIKPVSNDPNQSALTLDRTAVSRIHGPAESFTWPFVKTHNKNQRDTTRERTKEGAQLQGLMAERVLLSC